MSFNKISSTKTVLVLGALYQLRNVDIKKGYAKNGYANVDNIKRLVDIRIEDGKKRGWRHLNIDISNDDILKIIEIFNENSMIAFLQKDDLEHIHLSVCNDKIGNPAGLHRIIPIELINPEIEKKWIKKFLKKSN
jgi:hypothetical protein